MAQKKMTEAGHHVLPKSVFETETDADGNAFVKLKDDVRERANNAANKVLEGAIDRIMNIANGQHKN